MKHFLTCFLLFGSAVAVAAAPPARRPNILVVVADDWSYPHAGVHGTSWVRTPAFDQLAREGVLFSRAYTPVAKCSPSRACLLTGRNPWQLDEGFAHRGFFPVRYRTYAEALRDHGYAVGYTGKGWAPGVALTAERTPRALLGRAFDRRTLSPPTTGISRNDYAANFSDFLAGAEQAGAPWCFWVGAIEPHRPYEAGSGIVKGGRALPEIDRLPAFLPDDGRVRADLLDYAFEVDHFDRQLQRLLDVLTARGVREHTLVVVTSDNGMPFPRAKGECYDYANHLPLAVSWPAGITHPGRVVDDYVSLIDLAPTLLEIAGVEWGASGLAPAAGHSLVPLLRAERGGRIDPSRDAVLIGRERNGPGRPRNQGYPVRGIVRDDWLYLENAAPERWPGGNPEMGYLDVDVSPTKSLILQRRREAGHDRHWDLTFAKRGPRELYDLRRDPDCVANLAADPAQRARVGELQAALQRRLLAEGDPRQRGQPDYFDAFPFSYPIYNDYYERWRAGEVQLRDTVPASDLEPRPIAP